jgi:hypothetical protein
MALHFITSEEAQCHLLNDDKKNSEHTTQLHVGLSSLPSPDTPIAIDSFPIDICSETSVFRPRNVVNLWTQLLSIQIQSGHFWKHDNAVALHKEICPAKLSRDAVEEVEHEKLQKGGL